MADLGVPAHGSREPSDMLKRQVMDLLTFNPEDGRIWMDDKRMLLMDTVTFGNLRAELINSLGVEEARRVLTTIGYKAGIAAAHAVRRSRVADDDAVPLGPHLHALQGMTRSKAVLARREPKSGRFLEGEWIWQHSVEDDVQIDHFGIGSEAACWMGTGYATGYVSTLADEFVLFREVSCRSSGDQQCRIIARVAELWEDGGQSDLHYLGLADGGEQQNQPREASLPTSEAMLSSTGEDSHPIVGQSPALKSALHQLRLVAPTAASVLLIGESGVGKELFAQALHAESARADKPFVAVNCAAIPDTLIEAELFGVEKGAFTGALQPRPGRFERASGGTLFLDEIGTLDIVAQAKLLRVLQEKELERLGGSRTIKVDVRIVAATNLDLRVASAGGEFREDLFYRLNVFPIHLPPLRERRDDILLLTRHYLELFNRQHERTIAGLTPNAQRALLNYRYPGNIRELRNMLERAVILASQDRIDVAHLFTQGEALGGELFSVTGRGKLRNAVSAASPAFDASIERIASQLLDQFSDEDAASIIEFEESLFRALADKALAKVDGNISAAARLLGMKRHQFDYRVRSN